MVALWIQLQVKEANKSECSFSAFMGIISSSKSFVNIKQLIPLEALGTWEGEVSINVEKLFLLWGSFCLSDLLLKPGSFSADMKRTSIFSFLAGGCRRFETSKHDAFQVTLRSYKALQVLVPQHSLTHTHAHMHTHTLRLL